MLSLKFITLALISLAVFSAVPLSISPVSFYSIMETREDAPKAIDITYDWIFKTDPKSAGEREGWYALEYNDSDWNQIDAGVMWEEELGYDYNGWGWYRKWINIPEEWANHSVIIYIGAADDSAWIYTNGNLSGTHLGEELKSRDPDWWQHPFYINITEEILPGERNLISVKVYDWGGGGGMWKPPIALTIQPPGSLVLNRHTFLQSLIKSHLHDWVWPRWIHYERAKQEDRNRRYKAWTAIGVKDHRYEALVGPDSSIMPNKDAYTITNWIYDHSESKFYAPENILTFNSSLQQRLIGLLEGYLPIIQSRWAAGETQVETVYFADDIDSKDIIFAKIELENPSSKNKIVSLYIAVRPYGPGWGP